MQNARPHPGPLPQERERGRTPSRRWSAWAASLAPPDAAKSSLLNQAFVAPPLLGVRADQIVPVSIRHGAGCAQPISERKLKLALAAIPLYRVRELKFALVMQSSFSHSRMKFHLLAILTLLSLAGERARADTLVYLLDVPDYDWYAGCFGTGTGNLAGYWDRHGMSNFYTGPTGGGLAPLDSFGGNSGILSMWASKANVDGRPAGKPGHMDDYYVSYRSAADDPFVTQGRTEHTPDCIGDFIGLNQKKWTNLNNECRGNVDAFSFVFWDKTGRRRMNYYPSNTAGVYIPDIQSGLKEWARYRGYDADVFTQLSIFNPERSTTNGFTYDDVKAEINAGYPVLCFLQNNGNYSEPVGSIPNANPEIHGVMIYGYFSDPSTGRDKGIIIRTSWASGGSQQEQTVWTAAAWLGLFPVRGVIGFHPKPKVTDFSRAGGKIVLNWHGPSAQVYDEVSGTTTQPHRYCVQRATSLNPAKWTSIAGPTTDLSASFPDPGAETSFYRVVMIGQGNCP